MSTASGISTCLRWCPRWPFCPPGDFPLFCRKLLGGRTKRSEEGGKLLLWLSLACCPSRVLTRSCSESISPSRAFTCSRLRAKSHDSLFESFAQVLIRLVRLFQLFVFAPQFFK